MRMEFKIGTSGMQTTMQRNQRATCLVDQSPSENGQKTLNFKGQRYIFLNYRGVYFKNSKYIGEIFAFKHLHINFLFHFEMQEFVLDKKI